MMKSAGSQEHGRQLGGWLLVVLLLLPLSYGVQRFWNVQQVITPLETQIPARIKEVFNDVYRSQEVEALFLKRINQDLHWLSPDPVCAVQSSSTADSWLLNNRFTVHWQLEGQDYRSVFVVTCRINWPRLILAVILTTASLMVLLKFMPSRLGNRRAHWFGALLQQGERWFSACEGSRLAENLSPNQQHLLSRLMDDYGMGIKSTLSLVARPELSDLDERQVEWFLLGMQRSQGNFAAAEEIALTDEGLVFVPHENRVYVHGLPVQLSKTPFFYYLWYARLRADGESEGWYINPAVNRPDSQAAEDMVALMKAFGGHGKAINDLLQHGLRAKTLDQNRNKIKDELYAVLGETLAKDYVFETNRDAKTGRSRYRLVLSGDLIQLPSEKFN